MRIFMRIPCQECCWCEQKVVAQVQVLKVLERLFLQLINALFTLLMYVIRFWR